MVDLNITLLIQLVNFLITLVVLNWLIITPIRNVLAERRSKLDGLSVEASGFEAQAKEKLETYSAELTAARAAAAAERETMRAMASEREAAMLSVAHEQAGALLRERGEEILKEADTAKDDLRAQVPALAARVAARVLG